MKDEANKEVIGWNENGEIVIKDVKKFQDILTKYRRSNKMDSFSRQMNIYGFSKVVRLKPDYLIHDYIFVFTFHE